MFHDEGWLKNEMVKVNEWISWSLSQESQMIAEDV